MIILCRFGSSGGGGEVAQTLEEGVPSGRLQGQHSDSETPPGEEGP